MKAWPVQDAKARFSELLAACVSEGPQVVTRRGAETAVLVSVAEWKRLRNAARPSLKELLLSDSARANLALPARGRVKRRVGGLSGLSPGAKR
ncbi:MAG: type II toxin-antitoxin system Phd/YefM family antitoxin [Sulfuritalea sp.]|nr:type II toxin-antitoxin system Phd/YefM family antitoxin [Sulfuritalea sp.]